MPLDLVLSSWNTPFMDFDTTDLATLPSGDLIDSFDIFGPCCTRVLPPVQIKVEDIWWWGGTFPSEHWEKVFQFPLRGLDLAETHQACYY